jgi:hypothetical protein
LLAKQFRYLNGFTGGVGQDARALAEFGLQLFVEQRRSVRGADVPGVMSVTPAAVIGSISTVRVIRWSRIA